MAVEGFEDLDFHVFHRGELPRRISAGNGPLAASAVARQGSLAFRLPGGDAYTYALRDGAIEVIPGDEAADTVIGIDANAWEGLVHDYESAPGLLYGGRVECLRGDAMRFVRWEPGLRALYGGRPVYDPDGVSLQDRNGAPLDPEQTFALDSDSDDMAWFLRAAGYLLVRGAFAAEEIEAFRVEAQELRGEAVKGDKLSWWGRNAGGEEVLCRVTRAADKPRLATLKVDPRIRRLADLADEPLVHSKGEGNGVTVIYKNPDMVEGLSDIPWHRDCGMGGHSVMCPVLICSVFLTPATPETGELRFLPGSWQASCGYLNPASERTPRGARFAAEPGDLTLHYGDVMHAAPAPTGQDLPGYRISAITGFTRSDARNHRGAGSYNDVLHQREDGQIEHLEDLARRS
jgi:hypothetical protein